MLQLTDPTEGGLVAPIFPKPKNFASGSSPASQRPKISTRTKAALAAAKARDAKLDGDSKYARHEHPRYLGGQANAIMTRPIFSTSRLAARRFFGTASAPNVAGH
jgi:hypothetical protein